MSSRPTHRTRPHPTRPHPTCLARRLAVVTVGLATAAAGLVVAAPAPQAAPAPAPAPLALRAPDHYTPPAGARFNRPIGRKSQQYRLFTHINRAINSTPSGSVIRIAVYSFSDGRTADNLIRAHRRGVRVRLVFDDHHVFPAEQRLQRALGKKPGRRSFAILCHNSCRADGGEMHGKVYMFGRAGTARYVTMVGSNNMTSTNAEKQWSDLITLRNNPEMYAPFRRWFEQLKFDRPVSDPRIVEASRRNLALIMPQDTAKYGDPVLKALGPITCRRPEPAPRTRVLISAHAWYGPRGQAIANRVAALADNGCVVKVFHGDAFGSEIRKTLVGAGIPLATSTHRGIKTHQKLLIVRGAYGGNNNAQFVWTGSHNWSPWALKLDDVILRNANPAIVKTYARHFTDMWKNA
ncbi:phospholipase D-like domain-containing protein [Nocardioides guangzhouensis]|uniref:phospholipase D-like domain-containing protein n=1 Tax=Nocardioides guangzhouensis TaxID=2497878 RepID=UPI0014386C61|nr:phospholipase D-like domain-containing protein [Nocardioides guangzhouensis]